MLKVNMLLSGTRISHSLKSGILIFLKWVLMVLTSLLSRIYAHIHAYTYLSIWSLDNRPARLMYGVINSEAERIISYVTIREYINKYGFNELTKNNIEIKRQAILYYIDAILYERYSLIAVADSMLMSVQEVEPIGYGEMKAMVSKALSIPIPYNVTIEEWRGYLQLFNSSNYPMC